MKGSKMKKSMVSQTIQSLSLSTHEKKFDRICLRGNKFYFGEDNQYEIKIADTKELKEQAYKLIYKVYLDKNFITPNKEEMWYTKHDFKESTTTLVVLNHTNEVVGAMTLLFDEQKDLPVYSIFAEEMNHFHQEKKHRFAEIVSLGIKEDVRGAEEVLIKLFNFSYLICHKVFGMTDYVITVNPRHVTFYAKRYLFELFGDVKVYDKVGGAPANLLTLDLKMGAGYITDAQNNGKFKRTLYKDFLTEAEEQCVLPILKQSLRHKKINDFTHTDIQLDEDLLIAMA